MKFKSEKIYSIIGKGKDKKYPSTNLPVEFSDLIGKRFWIERSDDDRITLIPVEKAAKR